MSILNEEDNLIDEASKNKEVFRVPKVCFDDENEISLQKSMLISLILHPVVVGTVWLLTFILMLLGLVNPLAKRPELKMKDIEFVLVEKEAPPINKNTPYRADRDSRAGGKHDPTKKVSLPSAPGNKMQKSQQPSKPAKAQKPQAPQKASAPQPAQKPQQTAAAQPAPKPTKQPPSAKPSVRPPMTPKVVEKPTSKFTVPVPTGGTQAGKYSTGPVSGSGKVASRQLILQGQLHLLRLLHRQAAAPQAVLNLQTPAADTVLPAIRGRATLTALRGLTQSVSLISGLICENCKEELK